MKSKASTVAEYLRDLPEDRRAAISAVRAVILENLDSDFEECMSCGMIGYVVPHRVFPAGYHCDPQQPLLFAALASQKNYMSLYLMTVYGNPEIEAQLREAFAQAGRKLDMGKCCIRFKKLDDLPLPVVGEFIGRVTARKYVAHYEAAMSRGSTRKTAAKQAKPAKKVAASKPSQRGK